MGLEITNVKTILTAPAGINLVVVKVETSEPGLYGVGCATFTQRYTAVADAIDAYLKPFVIGKDPQRIEDIWQTAAVSGYWRNGPIMNNALSGIDMALWDIKGKLTGQPLYQLLGGKCREAAAVYRHADGRDLGAVEEQAQRFIEEGIRYIRCQWGGYGGRNDSVPPENALPGAYYDPAAYARSVVSLFDRMRARLGFEIELLHDVHERLQPIEAVRLAKQLEPYRLFFLEDPLAPEHLNALGTLRSQTATPIAIGELFVHPQEWTPMIAQGLIDYIRVHISAIGGITPARKLAALAEAFGVRTAWHGPGDVSPIGHAANLHLDLSCPNFGIQEWYEFPEAVREVFPGSPVVRNGYAYVNEAPGLGVDIDEAKAALYPCRNDLPAWTLARLPDGSPARP
ncbi:enolase C-terminal domain-like protein [Cohnella zeiphila]|nr:enolase C-terminal domain-like protein [Cohnella zeiphila]